MNKPNEPTYFEARKWASFRVKDNKQIDDSDIDFILEKRNNFSLTQLLANYRQKMPEKKWVEFQSDVNQLVSGMSPQYIVGVADFYGYEYQVNRDVLIPRIETEETIDWIIDETSKVFADPLKVLDIGTGSGVIAITLKKFRPNWQLFASDISSAALKVAENNAKRLKAEVKFIQSDVFQNISGKFDLIVSNPPYIAEDEKKYMDKSVIQNEPKIALFAGNEGLAVYQAIAKDLSAHLNQGGRAFFEIGFQQEEAVINIFKQSSPNFQVLKRHDTAGNQRMIQVINEGNKQ